MRRRLRFNILRIMTIRRWFGRCRRGDGREFAAFGWDPAVIPDPESVETFERSKLRWDEVHEGEHGEMLEWFRALIRLRRGSAALNDGDLGHVKVQFDEDKRWMVVDRGLVKVMFNLGGEDGGVGESGAIADGACFLRGYQG